jgi:hypothetical protein
MARGTGLPLPQSDATLQPGGLTEKPNAYSNADSWAQVAQAGAQLHARGVSMIERETHEAQTGYLAGAELDVDRDYLNMVDQHSKDGPDPQGFDKAWTAYTEGRLSKAEPWAVNHLRKLLKNKGNSGYGSLLNQKRGQDRALNAQRINALSEKAGDDVIAAAMSGSLGTDEGRARLAKYKSTLDAGVTSNLIPQEEADSRFADVTSRATAETIIKAVSDKYEASIGKGDALKIALDDAENLLLRSDSPALRGLSEAQRYEYFNKAKSAISTVDTQRNVGIQQLKTQIADYAATAKEGIQPPPEMVGALRQSVAASGNPELQYDLANAELTARVAEESNRTALPELQAATAAERQRLRSSGGTREEVDRLKIREGVLASMESGLKTDSTAFAERAGVIPVTELDFTNSETLAATLKNRVAAAEGGGRHYQVPPIYLKQPDKGQILAITAKGGDAMLGVLRGIAKGGGAATGKIMAQVFDDAPATALLGGLVAEVGDRASIVRDAADGIQLRQTDKYKPLGPKPDEARDAALKASRDALSEMAPDESAAIELTNAAYEARANVKRLKASDPFDEKLWSDTFNEVMGKRTINGEAYGGIINQTDNSWPWSDTGGIVVPPNVKAEGFRDLLGALRTEDLPDRPRHSDKSTATIGEVRNATLKSVGNGRYWVGTSSDPENPQYLTTETGELYVLDLKALEPVLRQRRPDLYAGDR